MDTKLWLVVRSKVVLLLTRISSKWHTLSISDYFELTFMSKTGGLQTAQM